MYMYQPDVTAPGVDILAAFTEFKSPTDFDGDTRRSPYFLLSGTSMSCPHVSGVAATLKSAHPDWSFTAIKSAIMTTGKNKLIYIQITGLFQYCSNIYKFSNYL